MAEHLDALSLVMQQTLDAVRPASVMSRAVRLDDAGENFLLCAHGHGPAYSIPRTGRVHLVGFGKAVAHMAAALLETPLATQVVGGFLIVPRQLDLQTLPTLAGRLTIAQGAVNNQPDDDAVTATRALVEYIKVIPPTEHAVVLISGGGSALLCAPRVPLTDFQQTSQLIQRAGGDIKVLNNIRQLLSTVKGGQLLQYFAQERVPALIMSDVVGDPIHLIASGPTCPSIADAQAARTFLEQTGLWPQLAPSVRESLKETMAVAPRAQAQPINLLVGNNCLARDAALAAAQALGWDSSSVDQDVEGPAPEVVKDMLHHVTALPAPLKRPHLYVVGGETTTVVLGQGRGGRNQECALRAALAMAQMPQEVVANWYFAAFGTDGQDGPTPAAGAAVHAATVALAQAAGLAAQAALDTSDSFSFFERAAMLAPAPTGRPVCRHLCPGLTGTNVMDILLLLRVPVGGS
ncbi:uncharacterized protein MONBRDRAFT_32121 [Monosiga brevicollis MX1]|uniref:Glycerate kinase n=1 Tax=Monosiga brevicollis TaxID=81824 RepID=A9UXS4_MONBE|nr:uncharacterized protein MONBRDRAFT_32121 [Monosiga brevicollis MX1]EDQ89738.1 predicted protein [Monosiga brevicollis MX1]|eukprot:XP_001745160.1 hypothetical protein [Monosiga brevicollis MX1]